MNDVVYGKVKPMGEKWQVDLILGLFLTTLGTWVFLTALKGNLSLAVCFGLALTMAGGLEIFDSGFFRKENSLRGGYVFGGVIQLLIGTYLLFNPSIANSIWPFVLAVWLSYSGILAMDISLKLNTLNHPDWAVVLTYGIASMVFALLIMLYPILGGIPIVLATAIAFLSSGIFHISMAYCFRRMQKRGTS